MTIMQIIAFGLHRHNISDRVWQNISDDNRSFYDFIRPLSEKEPQAEFMFVNSSLSKEILAVVDEREKVASHLADFFRKFLHLKDSEQIIFHDLEGPDAVKHFLQLAVGIEPVAGNFQDDFLQKTHQSIEIANDRNLAGPVINRIYHDALMLHGKIKKELLLFDPRPISQQIHQLISKIFGDIHKLKFLAIGQNEFTYPIVEQLIAKTQLKLLAFSSADANQEFYKSSYQAERVGFERLPELLAAGHVIFRLNQDARHLFQPDALTRIMHQRKNQPLLIVNLDSTIISESSLNRIYNLYMYSIADFLNGSLQTNQALEIQKLIEIELKSFFNWFYSKERYRFGEIVARSTAMEQILELIARISQTDITVLIQGESGTGKEIIARAIHQSSPRRDKPFIVVNCGALPETLLESELFGHEKGAFTGATYTKKGLFEEAHRGTIFLDEIGDTSPALQIKLLRVLQEGEIKRVGSNETICIDVRLIAATNQKLAELVEGKKFRQDLFYRLNVVNIDIPPLRERREDILPLAEYFMGKYADKMKKQVTGLTAHARQLLLNYSWNGNVRELENAIERAVALAIGNLVHSSDLPDAIRREIVPGIVRQNVKQRMTLKDIEKEVIQAALLANDWDYDKVAQILDIGRTTLWRKMKEYGIHR